MEASLSCWYASLSAACVDAKLPSVSRQPSGCVTRLISGPGIVTGIDAPEDTLPIYPSSPVIVLAEPRLGHQIRLLG